MITLQQVREYLDATDKPFQLVKHMDEVPADKLSFPCIVQRKLDGVFCAVVCTEEGSMAFTRTGKMLYLETKIDTSSMRSNNVYIAELGNVYISLETLSGLVNPNRVTPWTEEERNTMRLSYIEYHDVIPLQDFMLGRCAIPYVERWQTLNETHMFDTVESYVMHSEDSLLEYYHKVIAEGGEGVVRKSMKAPWVAGHKGFHSTKLVRDIHVDLRCTAVKYGKEGKHEHWIAALEFEYKGKKFWADLGKGWDNAKRDYLTKGYEHNRYNVIGQVFHVKALQESSKGVLRLPKVQEHRIDKERPDE